MIYYFGRTYDSSSWLWNPEDGSITEYTFPPWPGGQYPAQPFCGGLCMQPNGNVFQCGGFINNETYRGLPYTYMFSFNNNTQDWEWIPTGHLMHDGRWYPSVVTLGEGQGFGKLIAMSGYRTDLDPNGNPVVNDDPEIYTANVGWDFMQDRQAAKQLFTEEFDIYIHGFVIPAGPRAGKLFYPAPNLQAYVFNPFPSGAEEPYWSAVGAPHTGQKPRDANSLMLPLKPPYDEASFYLIGGGTPNAINTCKFISLMDAIPNWQSAPSLNFARSSAIGIVLPTDEIIIIGGAKSNLYVDPVLTPELINPTTERGEWKMLPAHQIARGHHSTGLLLPDGRIWVSGSDPGGNLNKSIEIYSPGYLLDMPDPSYRPVISDDTPDNIFYNTNFQISTNVDITEMRLIKMCATTHSMCTDMRSIALHFTGSSGNYTVTAPPDANVAPPGLYMLFVLRDKLFSISKQTMLPSIAKIVKLS